MAIRAVIFDCDGVLVDSVGLAGEVLAQYLRDLGFDVTRQEATRRFGSGRMAGYVARFESETGQRLPENFEHELRRRRELVFSERLRPVDGALSLIEALTLPSCVASNGPMRQIEHSLRTVGLIDRFQGRIFSAYSVRAWKPEPQLFLHAAKTLGVPAEDCAVVEDTELGLQAAVAAGMQAFAYLPAGGWSAQPGVKVLRALADLLGFIAAPASRRPGR